MDINKIASKVTKEATSEKNPAAVALGRLGGLVGGKARAAKLSAKKKERNSLKSCKKTLGKEMI